MQSFAAALKPHGLSPTQYNVLRILRASPGGLTCSEIGARMLTHDPDVTRLADRLAARGLVERVKDEGDRRRIIVRLVEEGLGVLKELDGAVAGFHQESLAPLKRAEIDTLIALLRLARGGE